MCLMIKIKFLARNFCFISNFAIIFISVAQHFYKKREGSRSGSGKPEKDTDHTDRDPEHCCLPLTLLFAGGVPAHGGEPSPEGRVRLPAVRGLQR